MNRAQILLDNFVEPTTEWKYHKLDKEVIIKDKLSQDLSLFYTVEDVRNLFKWQTEAPGYIKLFSKICVFLSGRLMVSLVDNLPDEEPLMICPDLFECPQDFEMIAQATLANTNIFNYLSEDTSARDRLYNVCMWDNVV